MLGYPLRFTSLLGWLSICWLSSVSGRWLVSSSCTCFFFPRCWRTYWRFDLDSCTWHRSALRPFETLKTVPVIAGIEPGFIIEELTRRTFWVPLCFLPRPSQRSVFDAFSSRNLISSKIPQTTVAGSIPLPRPLRNDVVFFFFFFFFFCLVLCVWLGGFVGCGGFGLYHPTGRLLPFGPDFHRLDHARLPYRLVTRPLTAPHAPVTPSSLHFFFFCQSRLGRYF